MGRFARNHAPARSPGKKPRARVRARIARNIVLRAREGDKWAGPLPPHRGLEGDDPARRTETPEDERAEGQELAEDPPCCA